MSKLKAAIVTMFLASSTAAMASPTVSYSAHANASFQWGTRTPAPVRPVYAPVYTPVYTPTIRDHRTAPLPVGSTWNTQGRFNDRNGRFNDGRMNDGGWDDRAYEQDFVQDKLIASDLTFANSDGRKYVTIGSEYGRFSALRITGTAGRPFVKQIYVQFMNDQEQHIFNVNESLSRGETLEFDLDGNGRHAIKRIVVYTNDTGSSIGASTGSFTVSGI